MTNNNPTSDDAPTSGRELIRQLLSTSPIVGHLGIHLTDKPCILGVCWVERRAAAIKRLIFGYGTTW